MSKQAFDDLQRAREQMWRNKYPVLTQRWDLAIGWMERHPELTVPKHLREMDVLVWIEEQMGIACAGDVIEGSLVELELGSLDDLLVAERKRAHTSWPYVSDERVRVVEAEYKRRGEELPEKRHQPTKEGAS